MQAADFSDLVRSRTKTISPRRRKDDGRLYWRDNLPSPLEETRPASFTGFWLHIVNIHPPAIYIDTLTAISVHGHAVIPADYRFGKTRMEAGNLTMVAKYLVDYALNNNPANPRPVADDGQRGFTLDYTKDLANYASLQAWANANNVTMQLAALRLMAWTLTNHPSPFIVNAAGDRR